MSWIKENKFLAGLAGGTLAGTILLFVAGYLGLSNYNKTKEKFDAGLSEVSAAEGIALYPSEENRDGKNKALEDYKKAVESLQTTFDKFRPQEIKDVTPQAFADSLLAANAEVRQAFEAAGATLPEQFFLGFERYKTSLAPASTTGILNYQMDAVKKLMLALAAAKPAELKNIYRATLLEEEGQSFDPATTVTREFPMEISFLGTEESVRNFFTAISKTENGYFVVRSARFTNQKQQAPNLSEAKFETAAPAEDASSDSGGGDFLLPGEEAPAAGADPAAATTDSSQILSQVLGSEKIQVFVRLDLVQFLPVKKLP
ncbi:MAG: hypothetical protein HC845_00420 [Akkermansiaceae bacterium]|nr:hypothetical protein [Akkermansiaceae bacterium]